MIITNLAGNSCYCYDPVSEKISFSIKTQCGCSNYIYITRFIDLPRNSYFALKDERERIEGHNPLSSKINNNDDDPLSSSNQV